MIYDILVETDDGAHREVAQVERCEQAVLIAEALYAHGLHIRYVWLVEVSEHGHPRLLDAWPQRRSDPDGCQASIAAWKAASHGMSGIAGASEEEEQP